jgi:superfamily II DNA or RNA helicase
VRADPERSVREKRQRAFRRPAGFVVNVDVLTSGFEFELNTVDYPHMALAICFRPFEWLF